MFLQLEGQSWDVLADHLHVGQFLMSHVAPVAQVTHHLQDATVLLVQVSLGSHQIIGQTETLRGWRSK